MVWVALLNLWLIVFDLTYLWLRPVYVRYLPAVTRIYDPVKGIEPHPLTEALRGTLLAVRELAARTPPPPELAARVEELRGLTLRVLLENPFERSGQERAYRLLVEDVARAAGTTADALRNPERLREAVTAMWPGDPAALRYRLDHLDPRLDRALALNFYRGFDRRGRLLDRFWELDLPFLVVFWIEFCVRWALAVRRREHARWYLFPLFNWYDVLGLLPTAYFRVFRLLRLVSVYMRLRRSELSSIGRDVVSRTVAYVSGILTEEVSDRVALRILSELEEEIRDGTHVRIARAVVQPRRARIRDAIAGELADLLSDRETLERLRRLLRLNLDNAIERSESLRSLPLPAVVVRPVARTIGQVVLDTVVETVGETLSGEAGRAALAEVVDAALEELLAGPAVAETEALAREISLAVIAHMKDVVAVKKWALPEDQERRQRFPWEVREGTPPGGSGR